MTQLGKIWLQRGAPSLFHRTFGGEVIRAVPFVYVPNVIAKVADIVSEHESVAVMRSAEYAL